MHTKVTVTAVLALMQFFKGYTALNPCTTPGFSLSQDQNYCFAYSVLSREAYTHSIVCHSYGTKLVNIEDSAKQTQVEQYLTAKGVTTTNNVFIGLGNKLNDANVWVWYGGNKTEFNYWEDGQPVIASRDNCVTMKAGNPDFKWKAASCLTGAFAVCEREATAADKA